MLIKVYTGLPGRIVLIEKVTDVIVHMGVYCNEDTGPTSGQTPPAPNDPTTWNYVETPIHNNMFKFIDYTDKNGVRTRVCVTAYAYVCNDEGRTIEKVDVGK